MGDEAAKNSTTDYHLHMEMISYLHSVYPNVSITLHAGELTPKIVSPEDLRFHISDAINTGNASRIGHGVDIKEEDGREKILEEMEEKEIPVEILLTSNQEILNINGPEHPVSIYLNHNVPVVIATDDPGIEGTNLSQEYINFTLSHPELSYKQIREINLNSIRYSYLSKNEKDRMLIQLEDRLEQFERNITPKLQDYFLHISHKMS